MWKFLAVPVLLGLVSKGLSQTLTVQVSGVTTTRRDFCVGEQLRFLCTISSGGYFWSVGSLFNESNGGQIITGPVTVTTSDAVFTLTTSGTSNDRTSTLEVVAFGSLSGMLISCRDSAGPSSQSIMVTVLGESSMTCPGDISATGKNNCTNVYVSLRDISRCTRQYSARIRGETEVISSVLSDTADRSILNIGIFNVTNLSMEMCTEYTVDVNVTYFNGSEDTTCSGSVILPTTNPPPDTSMLTSTTVRTTAPTSEMPSPKPTNTSTSTGLDDTIIIIIVVVVVCVLVIVVILVIIAICCLKCKKRTDSSKPEAGYDDFKPNQPDPHDQLPTYQDPKAIQREEAPDGSVYSMVDKKPKGSKKKSEKKDEVPMYSVVDKNNKDPNSQEGLVYTEVSVQSTSRSSRSRPPPPPGVAQLDANEPVVYSTVETPQQRQ